MFDRENVGWKMVHYFLGIDEKTEKSTFIRSECPYSVFEQNSKDRYTSTFDETYMMCSTLTILNISFIDYQTEH